MLDSEVLVTTKVKRRIILPIIPDIPVIDPDARLCPDCGATGDGAFCKLCGEEMEPALLSVRLYIKELLNDFLAFDGKLIRTVPMLMFHPGFLTQEYVAGRRKRYIGPSRLYIVVAFTSFVLLSLYLAGVVGSLLALPKESLHIGKMAPEQAVEFLQTLVRDFSTVFPYVLLLECSPLFALMLAVIYRNRGRLFVEHLTFTFHFFSFALLILLPTAIFVGNSKMMILNGIVSLASIAAVLVYLFKSLKLVYSDTGGRLAARFFLGSVTFIFTVGQAVVVATLVTLLLAYWKGDLHALSGGLSKWFF